MKQAGRYKKAILSILGGVTALLAVWGLDIPGGEETKMGIATIASTLLVIFGPKNAE